MNNTELWDKLGKTDPSHTKPFKRAGGFSGTAIKPMWAYRRMTEEFGPCGTGWGVYEPTFQVVPGPEGEMLVYCTASIWYGKPDQRAWGVGGDKAVGKNKYGLASDDEAFKKAFTDAITNALKMIGVGADVHMGMFDDNKYVNTMRDEFAEGPATKSSAALKREGAWETILEQFHGDLQDCKTLLSLEALKATYRAKAKEGGWTAAWMNALKDEFANAEEQIMNLMEKEEAA
ncbi:hypothetical protein [Nitratireductor indicus]|uniref:hypothetical protein n=1 Tax=Nitratireductor indicus TaxID=721133 RepID=UPI0028759AB6|nr:hypothetical protein [Nitratireductor indicus]MDS1138609.1 hypothetical protein [Nitratireductor indicus]